MRLWLTPFAVEIQQYPVLALRNALTPCSRCNALLVALLSTLTLRPASRMASLGHGETRPTGASARSVATEAGGNDPTCGVHGSPSFDGRLLWSTEIRSGALTPVVRRGGDPIAATPRRRSSSLSECVCQPASQIDYAKGYAALFTLPILNFGLCLCVVPDQAVSDS